MATTNTSPNVLLIHCHDLGRHLGCYGADLETPHIDGLAAEGLRFDEYFCTAPQCSPSRGSIMTGKHPQRNGLLGLTNVGGWEIPRGETTLPMCFNDSGYETHLFGIQHEVRENPGERLGYDTVHEGSNRALEVADRFAEALEEMTTLDAPFFASAGFFEPHRTYRQDYIDDEAYAARDPDDVDLPAFLEDRPGIREDVADVRTMIEETTDRAVGEMREALQSAGIEDETLIVFTTDHGLAMPGAKGTLYDPGIGTALVMRHPDLVPQGETDDHLLSNVDLLPTLMDLIGGESPDDLDGRSFASLLRDEDYEPREEIFAGMTWHDAYVPTRGIRTDRFKYVRNYSILPRVYLPADVFRGKAGMEMAHDYYTVNRPQEELYDLEIDPNEEHNLIEGGLYERGTEPDVPYEYSRVLETLRERLDEWQAATDDPIVDGHVAPPESPDRFW
jgi:arylsulfatase A-like enzyme